MNRSGWQAALLILPLLSGSAVVRADEFSDMDMGVGETRYGQYTIKNARWQVGLGLGYAFVQNPPTIRQTTTNPFTIVGITDSEAVVRTTGKLRNSVDLGLNVYRRLTGPWWAGLEMDYQVSHRVDAVMTNNPELSAFFQSIGITTTVSSHETVAEIIPCVKLSTNWTGPSRLYGVVGVGLASIQLSNTIHYWENGVDVFSADQDSQKYYTAAKAGVGMDYGLWSDGSVGFDLRYNMIFNPGADLRMVIPSLHFDYRF